MDMKEEKVKKLKEQFKKLYLDTVKHANDIEKWNLNKVINLGCIFYELCALEPPFNGRNDEEILKNVIIVL